MTQSLQSQEAAGLHSPMFCKLFHSCSEFGSESIALELFKSEYGWHGNPAVYKATFLWKLAKLCVNMLLPFLNQKWLNDRIFFLKKKTPKVWMQTSGCWGVGRLFFANLLADLLISDLDLSCPSKHIIFWYHKEMVSTQHTVCSIQKRHRYSTLGFFLQAHASINKAISGVSIPEPFASTNLNNSHFSLLFELSSTLTRRCTWF
jgi:hypothetical protein